MNTFTYFRIEKSTPTDFISTSHHVYHMESDRYRPGHIIYTDLYVLMTSDGTTTHLIAGNSTQHGYKEGVGADARFDYISGFTQISERLVVVADTNNHCMRLIDRTTNNTSGFSGQCMSRGYQDGHPGLFATPWSVVMDQRDKNQLLITDSSNNAVRTVDVMSRAAGTFLKSDSLRYIRGITQEEKSCDLIVTAYHAVYRITYIQRTVTLISGGTGSNSRGYRDSSLLDSLFYWPYELIFITPKTLLIADTWNNKLRLVDINSDQVTTLNVTNSLNLPASLLLTNHSLYVGQDEKITQYKCEYNITILYSFIKIIKFHTRQHVGYKIFSI